MKLLFKTLTIISLLGLSFFSLATYQQGNLVTYYSDRSDGKLKLCVLADDGKFYCKADTSAGEITIPH